MNENNDLQIEVQEDLPAASPEEHAEELCVEECDASSPLAGDDTPTDVASDDVEPVSAPVEEALDPCVEDVAEDPKSDRILMLERELADLRAEMERRDTELLHLESEREEFHALYPDRSLSTLPDSVWEQVRAGVPLAAAFALEERRRARESEIAAASNLRNRERSAGSLEGTDVGFFSPSEVRAMSQSEIRANYKQILNSMKKWH